MTFLQQVTLAAENFQNLGGMYADTEEAITAHEALVDLVDNANPDDMVKGLAVAGAIVPDFDY